MIKKNVPPEECEWPVLYTDGSACSDVGEAGWSVVAFDSTGDYAESRSGILGGGPKNTHVAEVYAAIKAIQYAKSNALGKCLIVHDYSGLWEIASGTVEPSYDVDSALYQRAQNCQSKIAGFTEVQGHSGIHGNEMADRLAWNARVLSRGHLLPPRLKAYANSQ